MIGKIFGWLLGIIFVVGGLVGAVGALYLYDVLMWGWVLLNFWEWFVIPVFVTVPVLTFGKAVGLMFFIGLFKSNYVGADINPELKTKGVGMNMMLLMPWVVLFLGWVTHLIW